MWPVPKIKQPKLRRFAFNNFVAGLITDVPATALPENAVSDIENFRYISSSMLDEAGNIVRGAIVAPRPGLTRISNTPLPDERECVAAYYFPYASGNGPCYVLAGYDTVNNNYKLYYLDASNDPVEIGDLDGKPTFNTFYNNLIISDGGITKVWDGSTLRKLDNYFEDEVVGTGDGAATQFTGNLNNLPVKESSVVITYVSGGTTYTITDDGSGNLIGDVDPAGNNTINYSTGAYDFTCSNTPDNGVNLLADYKQKEKGPKSTLCLKRPDRLWLVGDSDNPSYLWFSGSIVHAECLDIWNSDGAFATGGASANLGGGYQPIAKDDGTDLMSAAMFFNRLFLYKGETYYSVKFDENGFIDPSTGVEPRLWSVGCISTRLAITAQDTMLVLANEGLMDIKAVEASFGDLLTANMSKDRINKTILTHLNSNAYADYYPYDNQYWLQLDGLDYILVFDNVHKNWTKYKFSQEWAGFNWSPNDGEMLICGKNGHLYKLDRAVYKDDDTAFQPYLKTAYSNFGFPSFYKDIVQWAVLGEGDYGFNLGVKVYWDRSYSTSYDVNFPSAWTDNITVDDLTTMQVDDLDFFSFDDEPSRLEHYHNLFFRELMVKVTLEEWIDPSTYFKGIEFLGEVLPV